MSALWYWNTTPIYVSDQDIEREVKIAEIFILDATDTSKHYYGAGSEHRTLKGLVIGDTNRNAILSDAINGTSRTLTTPWTTYPNMKIISKPKFANVKYSGGTIDGVTYTANSTPIYQLDLEVVQS